MPIPELTEERLQRMLRDPYHEDVPELVAAVRAKDARIAELQIMAGLASEQLTEATEAIQTDVDRAVTALRAAAGKARARSELALLESAGFEQAADIVAGVAY